MRIFIPFDCLLSTWCDFSCKFSITGFISGLKISFWKDFLVSQQISITFPKYEYMSMTFETFEWMPKTFEKFEENLIWELSKTFEGFEKVTITLEKFEQRSIQ